MPKKQNKSENLKVFQSEDGQYFVQSSDGKIFYSVTVENGGLACTCADYTKNIKNDSGCTCKHMEAVIAGGRFENAVYVDKNKPRLDERFIMTLEGKDFVKYPGLLDLAHQKGIYTIEVDPIQLPCKDNEYFAICKATVVAHSGETFTDLGDANPNNCNSRVSKHLLRLASTRAIARALRSFTNIGMTCLEELSDVDEVTGNGSGNNKKSTVKKKQAKQVNAEKGKPSAPAQKEDAPVTDIKPKMSDAQKRAIYNLSKRRGMSDEDLEAMSAEIYGVTVEFLSSKEASSFIRELQQAA